MTDYYSVLGIARDAGPAEVKRAFRERAKQYHPDIAGEVAAAEMRKLLAAYEVLSNKDRRYEYDRALNRFAGVYRFDYRTFLRERGDPASRAKLILFELLHLGEDEAIALWEAAGGLDFALERCMDREDWMDTAFLLAEELFRRERYYESFVLLVRVVREERRRPYYRHFMQDIEAFLKEIVCFRLRGSVDTGTYVDCLKVMIGLGFDAQDQIRWSRAIAASRREMTPARGG